MLRRPAVRFTASLAVLAAILGHGLPCSAQVPTPQTQPPAVTAPTLPPSPPAGETNATPLPAGANAPPSPGAGTPLLPAPLPVPAPVDALAEAAKALTLGPALPPADPVAAAAYGVLDKHCARCHQGSKLSQPAPAAGLGNILRLDEMAATPHLVEPGNPDGSRLYTVMLRRLMPLDVHLGSAATPGPTSEELGAVRAWIAGLKPRPQCRDRRFVSAKDQMSALSRVASEAGDKARMIRFISIAHLHNGCERFDALAAYRQAVIKMINSLSWKAAAVPLVAVDESRTLFKLDLGDLGWLPEHWERIMRSGPAPKGLAPTMPAEVLEPFGTEIAIARADWLAATVLRAPLYYDVLGLPGTGPEILKILRGGDATATAGAASLRVGVAPSAVSIRPSLVEKVRSRIGSVWTAYHVIARNGETSNPADAVQTPASEPVPHHASRTLFTMPNGLPAFFIVGQRGDRLDALPPDIALPTTTGAGGQRAGLDCFACHGGGLARSPGLADGLARSPAAAKALEEDAAAFADAQRRMGLVPGGTLDGTEPVVALAQAYTAPLSAVRAVAELEVTPQTLLALADRDQSVGAVLARRLIQGVVARSEIEALGDRLVEALASSKGPTVAAASEQTAVAQTAPAGEPPFVPVDASPGPHLVLYSDKARYKAGDLLHLVVRAQTDCHLTLISLDQKDRATVLYPSDFETNTLITAAQPLHLPAASAPYSFRLRDKGTERVVALCNAVSATTDGIRHDFERQRFTDLGTYSDYMVKKAFAPADDRDEAAANSEGSRRRSRRRGRNEPPEVAAMPEQITRTAISIIVE